MMRKSSSHEEGGTRDFSVSAMELVGENGQVTKIRCARVTLNGGKLEAVAGSEFFVDADLVLLAMGFIHPEHGGILDQLGVNLNARGNVAVDQNFMTNVPGVFAAGDMQRGQSLVVWAIADGRKAARGIDQYLVGQSTLETPSAAGIVR
jgi:glutamate synthase (NADPH/NADH) small chain